MSVLLFLGVVEGPGRRDGDRGGGIGSPPPGATRRIGGFDAFIWRYSPWAPWTDAAPRIMALVEDVHGLPVWLLRGVARSLREQDHTGGPARRAADPEPADMGLLAREGRAGGPARKLPLPLVAKLSRGGRSEGVALISTRGEAERPIRQMFSIGLGSDGVHARRQGAALGKVHAAGPGDATRAVQGVARARLRALPGVHPGQHVRYAGGDPGRPRLGQPADGSRGDFRASGSGVSDLSAAAINPETLALTWRLADALGVRSLVTDVMQRGDLPVMGEFSFSMQAHPLRLVLGGPLAARRRWHPGTTSRSTGRGRSSRTSLPRYRPDRPSRNGSTLWRSERGCQAALFRTPSPLPRRDLRGFRRPPPLSRREKGRRAPRVRCRRTPTPYVHLVPALTPYGSRACPELRP